MFKDNNKVKVYFGYSMDSKLRWFTLMKKEIEIESISLVFASEFQYRVFWILHRTSISMENVPLIATSTLKLCLSMFIVSSSIFLLQNIYQCFDYCSKTPFYTIDQFPNFMALIYCFIIKLCNGL